MRWLMLALPPLLFAQEPEVIVQQGHSNIVRSVDFSPDGKYIVSGGADKRAILWDARTGLELKRLVGHNEQVYCVKFSPDGKIIATSSFDAIIRLWDAQTCALLRTYVGPGCGAESIQFSRDGKLAISAGGAGVIGLWNVSDATEIRAIAGHENQISQVVFSNSENEIVSGSMDETIRVWDVKTGAEKLKIKSPYGWVDSVAVIENDKYIVSGNRQNTTTVWDFATGKEVHTFKTKGPAKVAYIDGRLVAVGWGVIIYDFATRKEIYSTEKSYSGLTSIAVSPDRKYVACGCYESAILLLDSSSGRLLKILTGHTPAIRSVTFTPTCLATYLHKMNFSGTVSQYRFWDLQTVKEWRAPVAELQGNWLMGMSPRGKYVLTTEPTGFFEPFKNTIYEVATGAQVFTFNAHEMQPTDIAFSADENMVAIGSRTLDSGELTVWSISAKKRLAQINDGLALLGHLAFSPDGKLLAASALSRMHIWSTESWKEIRSLDALSPIVFSPDSKRIFATTVAKGKEISCWDVNSGEALFTLPSHCAYVYAMRLSEDGKMLAVGGDGVKVWNIETKSEVGHFKGHTDSVSEIDFRGDMMVTAGDDGMVKFWNVKSGSEIATIVPIDSSDYIIVTHDGYYTASKGAVDKVGFRIGERTFPFDQFDLRFNRPDIVLERIGMGSPQLIEAYRNAHLKRLRKMGLTEEMLARDFHLPEVALLTRDIPVTTAQKILKFRVRASDSEVLLDRLQVVVNDVPAFGLAGVRVHERKIETDITVELSCGRNKIQVYAMNERGGSSLKETFEVTYDGAEPPRATCVVSIGVSNYNVKEYSLKYAAKDAADIAAFLSSDKTLKLMDGAATRDGILKAKEFLAQSKVDDTVVVFIAGHGTLDDDLNYFFCPADTDFDNPAKRGLTYDDIEGLLDGIPARRKLLLMDTCHSGEVDKESVEVPMGKNVVVARDFRGLKPVRKKGGLGLRNSFELVQELFAHGRDGHFQRRRQRIRV